jgi:hypothetical protein
VGCSRSCGVTESGEHVQQEQQKHMRVSRWRSCRLGRETLRVGKDGEGRNEGEAVKERDKESGRRAVGQRLVKELGARERRAKTRPAGLGDEA